MFVLKKVTNLIAKLIEFDKILFFINQSFWKTEKLHYLCNPV